MKRKKTYNIKADRFYTLVEAQERSVVSSREYLVKYINSGDLLAIRIGDPKKKNGLRYIIKGAWLTSFNNRYKRTRCKTAPFEPEEFKLLVNRILHFCDDNNITTLDDLRDESDGIVISDSY